MVLACTVAAQATASRTFVSTTGNDSNTSANCSALANCRSFGAAISVTSPGGEVVVLSSGGYGPATISQPIVMTALGIDAAISVTTSGQDALTINAGTGNVTLRGLNLHGETTGANGVNVVSVAFLRLYDMLIENFSNTGVNVGVASNVSIYDSEINDNMAGLELTNASAIAYVENTSFDHNTYGVEIVAGMATVANSDAHYSNAAGFIANGGTLTLYNDRSIFNTTGMATSNGGTLYFANSLISNNTNAYNIAGGTTMAGTNPGTTLITPMQVMTGTLGTAIALK